MLRLPNSKFVALLLVTLMAMGLVAGCAVPAAPAPAAEGGGEAPAAAEEGGEETTISWLRLAEWTEADPSIIETFEASHPGIKVELEEIPFSELVSQINLRFGADDTTIDVVSVDVPLVSSYGYRDWLLPLNDVFTEDEKADWLPAALDAGTYEGNLIAAPVSTSTQLLYYHKDAFEAAGIEPPGEDERWTWEQVAQVAQDVQVGRLT